jgi:eukaryotic-like serine/threonine-protein kinase
MEKQSPRETPADATDPLATRPPERTEVQDSQPPPVRTGGNETVAPTGQTVAGEPPPGGTVAAVGTPSTKPGTKEKVNILGDYRLLKKLGEGGMGTVYKAHQISLDREVAVKVLSKQFAANPSFVERFQREARLMARLDHPNILRCFGVGEEHGWHYFAMEFIDGGSLQGCLERHGKLPLGDALRVVLTCAEALGHAHEQNMVHRDIKPDNILLTRKGVIKVADLGLAKAHGENVQLTRTGTGAGTPIYMSPEQARDAKHVDHRTDIYSLGCMLYTFLAGKPPFEGETYVELFEAKEKGKFPPARKFNDTVPERLDLILDKMMAKRPEHRYQSCAELIKDLGGLGLASDTLTLLEPEEAAPAQPTAVAPAKSVPAKKAAVRPTVPPKTAMPGDDIDPNIWYLSYRTRDGKLVRRRMTTAQVRDLIKDEDFDLKAQASRSPDDEFRALATYPEFEAALRGRIVKLKADRKAAKFHNLYAKLEKEERSRQRWRWFTNLFRSFTGWVLFLVWVAVLAGLAYGGFLLIRFGLQYLGTKMEAL